jgi:hypothetical protein
MKWPTHKSPLIILLLICTVSPVLAERPYYRYTDSNGVTVITSVLPPEYATKGYSVLDSQGFVIKVVPPAKTPEEIAEEARQRRLREEQKRIAREQAEYDRYLQKAYTDVASIEHARDDKLATIESHISITRHELNKEQKKLDALIARAATLERAAKPVPAGLKQNIIDYQERIRKKYLFIAEKRAEQEAIRLQYDADMQRFKELIGEKDPVQ